jgi:hypothetical protein
MHSSSATLRRGRCRKIYPAGKAARPLPGRALADGLRALCRAWHEHGDADDDGEDGEADGEEFENGHGGSPYKYIDVAVQYICLQAINKLSICDAGDMSGEWSVLFFTWQIFLIGISDGKCAGDDGAVLA